MGDFSEMKGLDLVVSLVWISNEILGALLT